MKLCHVKLVSFVILSDEGSCMKFGIEVVHDVLMMNCKLTNSFLFLWKDCNTK